VSPLEQQLLVGAVGGFIAAVITAGLALLGSWLTLRQYRNSDRLADERHLRDERGKRLRASIETVLLASLAIAQVLKESQALWSNETIELRNKRHTEILNEAWQGVNHARVSLMVQADGEALVKIVDSEILAPFQRYNNRVAINTQHPDSIPHKELKAEEDNVEKGVDRLKAESQRILDKLDKPI
jgi:hypothetical protein